MDRTRSIRYGVLGLLSRADNGLHGWAIKRQCERVFGGFWQVNLGEIYRVLGRLKNTGLAEHVEVTGAPSMRKVFRITHRGREQLREFLGQDPQDAPRPLREELAVKLLFAEASDIEGLLLLVERQRETYIRHLHAVVTHRRARRPEWADEFVTGLLIDGAEMHVRAEIAWLDRVAARVRERFRFS